MTRSSTRKVEIIGPVVKVSGKMIAGGRVVTYDTADTMPSNQLVQDLCTESVKKLMSLMDNPPEMESRSE